jgi:RimJ/RimL family protein N-acetyltransferase
VTGYGGVDWSSARVETARLLVRPLGPGDAAAVRAARDDAAVRRWAPALGDGPTGPGAGFLGAVVDRAGPGAGGALVGAARLDPAGQPVATTRLELWIAAPARRRGLGAEVVAGLASWAFRQGTGRVELLVAAANEPGQRLALAAGFRREGLLRSAAVEGRTRADAVLFGRLVTDQAGRAPRGLPDGGELTDGVVLLRPVRAADEEALLDERVDPESQRWATATRAWTRADVRAFVAAAPAAWLAGTEARFAIVHADSGICAGSIGLRRTVPGFGVAELGYGLRPGWRDRGLATRAVRLIADWAFTRAGIARLEIGTAVDNVASQRVAERAGFQREGVARLRLPTSTGDRTDEVRFGLVPPD